MQIIDCKIHLIKFEIPSSSPSQYGAWQSFNKLQLRNDILPFASITILPFKKIDICWSYQEECHQNRDVSSSLLEDPKNKRKLPWSRIKHHQNFSDKWLMSLYSGTLWLRASEWKWKHETKSEYNGRIQRQYIELCWWQWTHQFPLFLGSVVSTTQSYFAVSDIWSRTYLVAERFTFHQFLSVWCRSFEDRGSGHLRWTDTPELENNNAAFSLVGNFTFISMLCWRRHYWQNWKYRDSSDRKIELKFWRKYLHSRTMHFWVRLVENILRKYSFIWHQILQYCFLILLSFHSWYSRHFSSRILIELHSKWSIKMRNILTSFWRLVTDR